jgi:hypothetical protein
MRPKRQIVSPVVLLALLAGCVGYIYWGMAKEVRSVQAQVVNTCPQNYQPIQSLNGRNSQGVAVVNACISNFSGQILYLGTLQSGTATGIWFGGNMGGSNVMPGATTFSTPFSSFNSSVNSSYFIVPQSGVLRNLFVATSSASVASALAVTAMTCTPVGLTCNFLATSLSIPILPGTSGEFSDTTDYVNVNAGDFVALRWVNSAGSASGQINGWTLTETVP